MNQVPYMPRIYYTFDHFVDSVVDISVYGNKIYTDESYCGPLTYELLRQSDNSSYPTDLYTFNFDGEKIRMSTYTSNHNYQNMVIPMMIKISVSKHRDYPVGIYKFNFNGFLCKVTSLEYPKISPINYIFASGKISFGAEGIYRQVPDCAYEAEITSYWKNETKFNDKKIQYS